MQVWREGLLLSCEVPSEKGGIRAGCFPEPDTGVLYHTQTANVTGKAMNSGANLPPLHPRCSHH